MTGETKRYAFDLDGTLCETEGMAYGEAQPIEERVAVVQQLHADGHYIIIHTARGQSMNTHQRRALFSLTRRQLNAWGIRYHELRAKPFAHVYVDDRAVSDTDFFHTVRGGN